MSLSQILSQMESNKVNAAMNPNMGPPETLNGRIGLKRAAVEENKRLRLQYRKELMSQAVFIVVTGSGKDNFSQVASNDEFGCFVTDPDDFFKDLSSRIEPKLFGRENTKNLFNIVTNILEDKAMELDLNSYPMLQFNGRYNLTVNSAAELVPVVRQAIVDQIGSELVGINSVYSVVDKAIEKGYSATVTPMVLSTSDERFALDLSKNLKRLTQKVFLVAVGQASKELKGTLGVFSLKNATEETVGRTLTDIRSKIG